MIWRHNEWNRCWLAGAILLCLPLGAFAQVDAERDVALSEDLRVMSALVDDTVHSFYQKLGTANCMNCHTGNFNGGEAIWPSSLLSEGEYHSSLTSWHYGATPSAANATFIDGVGAVIQLTAPALPHMDTIKLGTQIRQEPLSRWEKMRRKLQGGDRVVDGYGEFGDGMTVDLKAVLVSRDDLVNQLVALLAESGHNFRNLGADERISISLTFEQGAYATGVWDTLKYRETPVITPTTTRASSGEGGETPGNLGGEGAAPTTTPQYNRSSVPVLGNIPLVSQLFADNKKAPLPVRVTVSATKAQIDAVASGALSTEDFRERVQVRIIDPHAEATDENTSDGN